MKARLASCHKKSVGNIVGSTGREVTDGLISTTVGAKRALMYSDMSRL